MFTKTIFIEILHVHKGHPLNGPETSVWEPCGVGAGASRHSVWVLAGGSGQGPGTQVPVMEGPARQRWGGGLEHSDRTLLGGLVQMCSVQDPRADPELSADQADPRGRSRGQTAGQAEAHFRSLSPACSRDALAVTGQDH